MFLMGTTAARAASPHATINALTPSSPSALELEKWLERGGTTQAGRAVPTTAPPSGIPTASDWWVKEHRPIPGQPSSALMHADLREETQLLRNRIGLRPAMGALSTIGLGATAAVTGWQIGTAIRSFYIRSTVQAPSTAGLFTAMVPFTKGATIAPDPSGGASWTAARDGVAIRTSQGGSTFIYSSGSDGECAVKYGARPAKPAGFTPHSRSLSYNTSGCAGPSPEYEQTLLYAANVLESPTEAPETGVTYSPRAACSTCTNAAPDTISGNMLTQLKDNPADYPVLGQTIDNGLGGPSSDPIVARSTVPNCTGDLYDACASKITSAGLVPARTTLTPAQADIEKPADSVVSTSPASGETADTDSTVTVTANPGTSTMPVLVPSIAAGQTYAQYLADLQARGLVGSSVVLSDALLDPTRGPNAAVRATPEPGTRVAPGTAVEVSTNPATAPTPGAGAGSMPDVPAINLEPLSQGTPCTTFPFGVPCWVVGALGGFSGSANCPSWDFPLGGYFSEDGLTLDLCVLQPAVDIFRPLLLVATFLGLGWLFMGAAMGFGGKGGDD